MKVVKHILKISNDVCFAFTSNTNEENASATINSENKLLKIESKNNTMKTRMLFALILLYTVLVNAQTALDFNPSEGIQEVDIPTITCPSEFTIETWINLRATGSYPTILEFGGGRLFLGLEFTSDKLTLFDAFVSNTSIPLNTWTHVAVSYSTVNSEAKLYINGVLDITATNVTVDTNGVGASIGYNNGDDVFNGAIDEVRIWNRVLSEDEIDANKTSCLTGNETGLHAYYNFNEGSGTTANDLSPNNFNGTLVNMDPATDWVSFTSCDPSTHFVTTWNTGNTFNPVKSVITVPTTGGGYNYDVDWDNDGVFDQFGITGDVSFDYGVEGIYTIRIQGSFPRMYCEGNPDQGTKLISIDQWGAIKWQSFEGAFKDTSELSILALDVPDLSQVTSMARAFMNALAQFSPTFLNANSWNMSTITDMSSMFEDSLFNSPISNWDVSNVTNMNRMFNDDSSFNQDISAWNVSSVMDMANMFFDATNFNQDIGSWDVSSVTTMRDMFRNANAFDQNLENWDISSLNNAIKIFDNITLNTANYDALLIGWSTDSSGVSGDGIDDVPSNLTFDGGNSQYCVGEFERNQLDTNFNWNISDGGRFCPDPSTHFVTTWNTGSTFSPIKSVITILTTGGGYNYDVDWDNDGV
ncbi:MAG: BspA family leucine-rich repeat surface protein, partial [Bacteroidota bacterium]